jgi:hypothetical protein
MNRYEQRKRKFLQDPEVAKGYQEMEAEFQFMQTLPPSLAAFISSLRLRMLQTASSVHLYWKHNPHE